MQQQQNLNNTNIHIHQFTSTHTVQSVQRQANKLVSKRAGRQAGKQASRQWTNRSAVCLIAAVAIIAVPSHIGRHLYKYKVCNNIVPSHPISNTRYVHTYEGTHKAKHTVISSDFPIAFFFSFNNIIYLFAVASFVRLLVRNASMPNVVPSNTLTHNHKRNIMPYYIVHWCQLWNLVSV